MGVQQYYPVGGYNRPGELAGQELLNIVYLGDQSPAYHRFQPLRMSVHAGGEKGVSQLKGSQKFLTVNHLLSITPGGRAGPG